MNGKYLLGVDGGGTKTDYLLFTTEGELVDSLRVGTRGHEYLEGAFDEAEEKIFADLELLYDKNNISASDIAGAAFGLSGIDIPSQHEKMSGIIKKSALKKFVIGNDSFLGIKAGCISGFGICSINGTGTVVTGINENGEMLQVGGIGLASGDNAGGYFLAALTLKAVYDYHYRCGEYTKLSERIMELFNIDNPCQLMDAISKNFNYTREFDKSITTILFEAANENDFVSTRIVCYVANELAKSVSGCILKLGFKKAPEIVLAGSLWTKSGCSLQISHFKERILHYTGEIVDPKPLSAIPAAGAIIWALELAHDHPVDASLRDRIIKCF